MVSKLLDFHLSCKQEYAVILNKFNILFYGFGNKMPVLKSLFPSACFFNCNLLRPNEIFQELLKKNVERIKKNAYPLIKSMKDLDDNIKGKKRIILVFTNFNFTDMNDFSSLKNFSIIATFENIDVKFSSEDVERFNFIYRDLTTYLPYEEDILDIKLKDSSILNLLSIFKNVPKKSKYVIKEILASHGKSISFDDLFERIKMELFLVSKRAILPLINEFIDHNILKIKDNREIIVNVSDTKRKKVLDSWNEIE